MPTFKVQRQVHHCIKLSLLAKYLQIYFTRNEEQARVSYNYFKEIRFEIVSGLQDTLHKENRYIKEFKMAVENNSTEEMELFIPAYVIQNGEHAERYNA